MDLTLTEEQRELVGLAAEILSDGAKPDALLERERAGVTGYDQGLWASFARAGLVGVGVPEEYSGLGFGFLESCLLLEQVGRTCAPIPAVPVLGAVLPLLVRYATAEQKAQLLEPLAAGRIVVTAALTELGSDPRRPSTTATRDSGGWVLRGEKTGVQAGTEAAAILVSAHAEGLGPRLFVVDPAVSGVDVRPQPTVAGAVDAWVGLGGVRVADTALLGSPEPEASPDPVTVGLRHLTVATCAVTAGVTAAAVDLTSAYVKTREAFGRPLAAFQAVGQRAADAFTSAWTVSLSAREAAWALADGRDGALEVATAKYYAAASGLEVMRAAHHLHGGIGTDRDYPLHRFTNWARRYELSLGGAAAQIEQLGDLIAEGAVAS